MRRINLLSQDTANKIAAGEVVERASSVVKELVENSIDANGKNIIIEIEDSGTSLIRISDDGNGIHPEDMEKAFMPHGTSKIHTIDEIFAISTFGFRGEALASIAAISKVKMISRAPEFEFGKEIYLEGGEIKYIKDVGANVGTTIEIKNLFYNVPARQKFLKSPQRENSIINDLVLRLALGNHSVTFKLYSNGKEVFSSLGTNNSKDTIRAVYGKEVYNNVIPFESHSDIISVHGFIGNREISRGSRNRQSIFVNKRLIKSSLITAAVENAFKSFITVNKFPFFLVYIDIFPDYIDPNVHPTKAEIKFFDEKAIFKLVFDGVHSALRESLRNSFNIEEDIQCDFKERTEQITTVEFPVDFSSSKEDSLPSFKDLDRDDLKKSFGEGLKTYELKNTDLEKKNTEVFEKADENEDKPEKNQVYYETREQVKTPKFPSIRLIGQFNNTYILGEYMNELYLVDQHAAHEKILFEKYRKSIMNLQVISQILLTPLVLDLSHEDFPYYIENQEVFASCGFDIEVFGGNSIAIREVPMMLGKPNVKDLFYDIIENLKALGSGKTIDVKYDKIASLACKAAVKANDRLSDKEMEVLIEDLRYIDEPFTCPHGRPTIIKIGLQELEKRFKRIQ